MGAAVNAAAALEAAEHAKQLAEQALAAASAGDDGDNATAALPPPMQNSGWRSCLQEMLSHLSTI